MSHFHLEPVANYHCNTGENPLWDDRRDAVYWTDIPAGRLFRYDRRVDRHEPIYQGEQVGGFTLQEDGSLLLFRVNDIAVMREDGSVESIIPFEDESIPRFNDVMADPAGRVFAGTMGRKNDEGGTGGLFLVDLDGTITNLWRGTTVSNGMGFSPDRSTFYWTCSTTRRIFAFDYNEQNGSLTNRRLFYQAVDGEGTPDGMTVDSEGHIWTTRWGGWAVRHLDPSGRFVEKIDMPVERVSSCAFGGPNLDELYITTAGGQPDRDTPEGTLYRVAMPVKGQREFRSRIRL